MAPFVPISDGVQAELVYVLDSQVLSSRLWFTYDSPPWDYAALLGLATGLHGWCAAYLMPFLAHELILYQTRVTDWTTDPPGLVAEYFGAIQGDDMGGCHPANVAVVVPFRWPIGFRLRRNKHYVPGVPVGQVTLNTVSDELTDGLFEAYAALVDAARDFEPALTWRWRVASSWSAGALRSEQLVKSSQGPSFSRPYKLGQRRRRLPP